MAFDGCGSQNGDFNNTSLKIFGAVFRHPNLSCNFVYFDGHAENIRSTDIAGGTTSFQIGSAGTITAAVPMDFRMLPVQPQ